MFTFSVALWRVFATACIHLRYMESDMPITRPVTECHERQPFGYVLRQGEREHHTINVYQKSHPAPISLNPAGRGA
jgi:hypothetical protein